MRLPAVDGGLPGRGRWNDARPSPFVLDLRNQSPHHRGREGGLVVFSRKLDQRTDRVVSGEATESTTKLATDCG